MTPVLGNIEIINGGHDPDLPFMIVNRNGMCLDLSNVGGELFDPKTTARIRWGLTDNVGCVYGEVIGKDGSIKRFAHHELMWPYLKAWMIAHRAAEEIHKHNELMAMGTIPEVPLG